MALAGIVTVRAPQVPLRMSSSAARPNRRSARSLGGDAVSQNARSHGSPEVPSNAGSVTSVVPASPLAVTTTA
jgi:hypothetical protein